MSLAGDPDIFTPVVTNNVFFFTARVGVSLISQLLRLDFNRSPNGFESKMVDPKATVHYATICLRCTLAKQLQCRLSSTLQWPLQRSIYRYVS